MKGFLIVFEGIDRAGKKTQVKLLTERLKGEGYKVEKLSFPDYSTPLGKEIKAFLDGKRDYNTQVRHILYAANRWERKDDLEKWLKDGRMVVVDRYYQSNLAYGTANNLDLNWLLNLEKGLPKEDLVIILDISPETSFVRKGVGRDLYERDLTFLGKVREAYHHLAERFGWVIVNGERKIEEVHNEVWRIIQELLKSPQMV